MVIYTLRVNKKLFYFKRGHPVFVISETFFFSVFFKWVYAIGILRLPFNEMDFNLCEKHFWQKNRMLSKFEPIFLFGFVCMDK